MSIDSNTNTIDDNHPLALFLSMLGSPESKRQYPKRLQHFFNFLKLEGDIQDQSSLFAKQFKNKDDDGEELEGRLLAFARYQKERVAKKEVSPSTVPNYFKAIKLFCQANRISKNIEWKNISKAMPRGFSAADDRAPTLEEIQKLLEFPDRRIKPLVLTLVSSGIRIGAFEELKWKHITPFYDQKTNDILAAKILVYVGDREQYYSFLTSEAFIALKEWMDYRSACGENITKESLVMRDIWQTDDTEGAANPRPLNSSAITRLLNRAWQAQKIRPKLQKGEKRHEFKTAHGFRKYWKSQAEQARIPSIKIELLMGHSLGISDSYVRFTEDQMLEDYLKTTDFLTVNQTVVLINKSLKKQEETIHKSLKEMEERHKTEITAVHEKYESKINELETSMQKQQTIVAEQNEKQKTMSKEWIQHLNFMDERLVKMSNDMSSFKNNLLQSAEKTFSLLKPSDWYNSSIMEYLDKNPKVKKDVEDIFHKLDVDFPSNNEIKKIK